MKSKTILFLASIFGALAVILGAFGAHALSDVLEMKQLSSYKTGNLYHFIHTFLLLMIGILFHNLSRLWRLIALWACIAGIVCFSGSLYILACRDLLSITNTAILGPITPIGGLFFILSWISLGIGILNHTNE